LSELREEYWHKVAFANSLREAYRGGVRDLALEKEIRQIERVLVDHWLEVLESSIALAETHKSLDEINESLPKRLFDKFTQVSLKLEALSRQVYQLSPVEDPSLGMVQLRAEIG
jgi:formyltetrahydrofolate synthetase